MCIIHFSTGSWVRNGCQLHLPQQWYVTIIKCSAGQIRCIHVDMGKYWNHCTTFTHLFLLLWPVKNKWITHVFSNKVKLAGFQICWALVGYGQFRLSYDTEQFTLFAQNPKWHRYTLFETQGQNIRYALLQEITIYVKTQTAIIV